MATRRKYLEKDRKENGVMLKNTASFLQGAVLDILKRYIKV